MRKNFKERVKLNNTELMHKNKDLGLTYFKLRPKNTKSLAKIMDNK